MDRDEYRNDSYNNFGYRPDFGSGNENRTRSKAPKYVTRKAFIAGIICAMIATSGLTIGGLALGGAFNKIVGSGDATVKTISATNYTLADATDTTKSVEEIVAMNENAVVEIQTETVVTDTWMMNYVSQGAGSGVIIDSDGYIITCQHVIEDAKSVTVTTKDGTQHKAKVIGEDKTTDIAVLKIEGSGFTAVQYGNSDELSVGDLAVAIGNPLGKLGGTASVGIISALDRELTIEGQLMNLLQTDASINPGNSGGGLFDGNGNLIGIVEAKSIGSDVEGLGFAVPINDAAEIAKQLIENGKVSGRPLIGVSVIDATDSAIAAQYKIEEPGLYIYEVSGKEATEAGLESGDMIAEINGVPLNSRSDLTEELGKYKPGDTITITIVREGETLKIDTVLTEAH